MTVSGGPRRTAPGIPRVLAPLARAPFAEAKGAGWMDVPSAEAPAFAGMTEVGAGRTWVGVRTDEGECGMGKRLGGGGLLFGV